MGHVLEKILVESTVALALLRGVAWAQPAGTPPVVVAAAAEAEARAHFKLAEAHFNKGEWRDALDEYTKSMAFKKTKGAMASAASCLRQLGQYDDALDQYEELRREFPILSAKIEAAVGPAMVELSALVGTLTVAGDAPAGASLFVDDRKRGTLPLRAPLRLRVGSHTIRVEKEGFEALTATVEVKPGQQNVATVEAKSKKGRLHVSEKHGWVLQVEVDGKNVGVTPWNELVDAGEHRVRLHGLVSVEAIASCDVPEAAAEGGGLATEERAKLASNTETVAVGLYEERPVVLVAEEQDASLKVESTPRGAVVKIDAKEVGKTPWEGRLGLGQHALEVTAAGFLPTKQVVQLERRKQRELSLLLQQEVDKEAGFRVGKKIGVGVAYGVGALGLGLFVVTGGMALEQTNAVRSACGGNSCPASKQADLDLAASLGTASTVGLVVGGIGVAAGTVVLFAVHPEPTQSRGGGVPPGSRPTGAAAWSVGAGPGAFEIRGTF